jgi:pyridinium-3,5-bisthiocarboxylic acid mononucleotide nickel chelatase
MGNILKIEAFAGMSGDMFLGALCGLADAYDKIKELPFLLHLQKEVTIEVRAVSKNGIACNHVKVVDQLRNIDNGKRIPVPLNLQKNPSHHHHAHTPGVFDPKHKSSSHSHRNLKDINDLIERGEISERAKIIAKEIFLHLGTAESKIHGIPLEHVHFHEVGAIDSIMDIVGSAWLLDKLDVAHSYCTPITTGYGFAMTEHGKLPIPCPATQLLLHGMPTLAGGEQGEMTTPTGAAILKYLDPEFNIPVLKEMKTSYGPGEKDFSIPNTLRLSICGPVNKESEVMILQTNIDDLSGELMGVEFQQDLLDAGALDFYMEQTIMKKGRPGIILNVICPKQTVEKLAVFILEKTSSIGIRYFSAHRLELSRKNYVINTSVGKVSVKEVETPSGQRRVKIESKDLLRIAKELDKNPLEINQIILNEFNHEKSH